MQTEKRKMTGLYSIPLAGLKEGRYTYEFTIGDDFFEVYEGSEIIRGEMKAEVTLEKRSTHLELTVVITGSAEVICDRCLDPFYLSLSCTNKLYVKQGREWEEDDPDMIIMPADDHELDMMQYFYEYIHLALPLKRTHPDDSKGHSTCDPEMIRKLKDLLVTGEEETDARWDGLKKLSENN